MRAEFWLPFAHLLHLSPSDIDGLTVAEFDQAVAYVKKEWGA